MTSAGSKPARAVRLGAGRSAAVVCLSIVVMATALGAWLYGERLRQLETTTSMVASQSRGHLQAWMDARLTGMRMLSAHWPRDYQNDLPAFARDAALLQQRLPGLLALNWMDTEGVIRLVVPEAGNRAALGSDLMAHPNPDVPRAINEAMSRGEPVRTGPLELLQGGLGLAFYWPVAGVDGAPAGFLNGVFRIEDLVAASHLADEIGEGFLIELRTGSDGAVVWSSAPAAARPWRLEVALPVAIAGGPDMLLAMAPAPQTIAQALSVTQLVALLGICYLVAVLLALLVRQRAEEQTRVRRRERKFRELVELLPHPVYVKDERGRFSYVNPALADACGRPAAALLEDGADGPAVLSERQVRADAEVLASGEAMAVREEEFRGADGRVRVLEMVRVPFVDPVTGKPSVLGMGVDVTERLESQAHGARIASALNQAGEAITVLDRRGRLVFANPAFVKMMGYSGDSVIGLSMDAFVVDDGDTELLADIAETLGRGETWRRRYGSVWKDGIERVRDATVAPVRDADGRIDGYIGVLRDVTREQHLEDELRQSQKLEAVGQLAGGIAHDFNNLLTVILGYAGQLRDQAPPGTPTPKAVREIERAAERAADLTRQLLTFSRRGSRQAEVARLNDVVSELNPMLARLIGENISIAVDLDPAVAEVSAATSELEQIIVNLCVNARDAMPDGGRLRLWTARRQAGAESAPVRPGLPGGWYAVLGVTDSGVGMTADVQQRIFDPFFTTKDVGAGTGLGLSTVYGIAEQRHGGVQVESAPGRGTTVAVWLPVAAPRSDADRDPERGPTPTPGAAARVLVVEDEQGIRELMRKALEGAGYRVVVAADGVEALQRGADLDRLDLLVTDVVMPRMNGPELRRQLARRHPGLRVLFVSGYAPGPTPGGRVEADDAFLGKPFKASELVAEVERTLAADEVRSAG